MSRGTGGGRWWRLSGAGSRGTAPGLTDEGPARAQAGGSPQGWQSSSC